MTYTAFKKTVWAYYKRHARDLPWRKTRAPYKILVSEIMLQQTQVDRVKAKYESFLKKFPTITDLAKTPLKQVLLEWQGLGYNRRALNLKRAAEIIETEYKGKLPKDYKKLLTLPGVGPATAGDIMAFAWNTPAIVIETNIRTVFLHHFFNDASCKEIDDKDILPLIEKTLDRESPRDWYWALLDYGSFLKKTIGNANIKSRHYTKQKPFKGSDRELRSRILAEILSTPGQPTGDLSKKLKKEPARVRTLVASLVREGLLTKKGAKLFVA